jgi:hypothetical protein
MQFAPEEVWPFPKAAADKIKSKPKRRTRKAAILTDTPEKEMLEVQQRKTKLAKEKKLNKTKQLPKQVANNIEPDEYYCAICNDPYSISRPGENWIKCKKCNSWAHLACTDRRKRTFQCEECS